MVFAYGKCEAYIKRDEPISVYLFVYSNPYKRYHIGWQDLSIRGNTRWLPRRCSHRPRAYYRHVQLGDEPVSRKAVVAPCSCSFIRLSSLVLAVLRYRISQSEETM